MKPAAKPIKPETKPVKPTKPVSKPIKPASKPAGKKEIEKKKVEEKVAEKKETEKKEEKKETEKKSPGKQNVAELRKKVILPTRPYQPPVRKQKEEIKEELKPVVKTPVKIDRKSKDLKKVMEEFKKKKTGISPEKEVKEEKKQEEKKEEGLKKVVKKPKKNEKKKEENKKKDEKKKDEKKIDDKKKDGKKKKEKKKDDKKKDEKKKDEKKKNDKKKNEKKKDEKKKDVKKKDEKKKDKPKKEEEIEIKEKKEEVEMKEKKQRPPSKPGESWILRNPRLKEDEKLLETLFEGVNTIDRCFEKSFDMHKQKEMYGFRQVIKEHSIKDMKKMKELITYEHGPWKTLTYHQCWRIAKCIAIGLKKKYPDYKRGSQIGVYLDTCKEWIIFALACFLNGWTIVTVYANLGVEALIGVCKKCEFEVLLCSGKQTSFIDEKLGDKVNIKDLVCVGEIKSVSKKFNAYSIFDLIVTGEKYKNTEIRDDQRAKPEDIGIIMFTSGTTGEPKGVMMKHKSVVAAASSYVREFEITEKDVHLSYLPLAHTFELCVHLCFLFAGSFVGFGNPRTLVKKPGGAKYFGDMEIVRPTIFIGVPRVWETIKKSIFNKLKSSWKISKMLFDSVYEKKLKGLNDGEIKDVALENQVFSKIRNFVGGRVRIIASGGASMSGETQNFLQASLGKKTAIIQGYALTETCTGGTVQDWKKFTGVEHIGHPLPCCEVKLIDIPSMNYSTDSDEPEGEICIRGTSISSGYYKMPKKTEEVFSKDGWFKTGDVGRITKDGYLKIIDRVKNLVKLSQGEYVAVEALEVKYATSPFIFPNGICITPKVNEEYIAALVIPEEVYCKNWAKEKGMTSSKIEDIIKHSDFKRELLDDIKKIGNEQKLKSWEIPKMIEVITDVWTPENGCLTAAIKLNRREIAKKYEEVINKMYCSNGKLNESVEKNKDIPDFYSIFDY